MKKFLLAFLFSCVLISGVNANSNSQINQKKKGTIQKQLALMIQQQPKQQVQLLQKEELLETAEIQKHKELLNKLDNTLTNELINFLTYGPLAQSSITTVEINFFTNSKGNHDRDIQLENQYIRPALNIFIDATRHEDVYAGRRVTFSTYGYARSYNEIKQGVLRPLMADFTDAIQAEISEQKTGLKNFIALDEIRQVENSGLYAFNVYGFTIDTVDYLNGTLYDLVKVIAKKMGCSYFRVITHSKSPNNVQAPNYAVRNMNNSMQLKNLPRLMQKNGFDIQQTGNNTVNIHLNDIKEFSDDKNLNADDNKQEQQ